MSLSSFEFLWEWSLHAKTNQFMTSLWLKFPHRPNSAQKILLTFPQFLSRDPTHLVSMYVLVWQMLCILPVELLAVWFSFFLDAVSSLLPSYSGLSFVRLALTEVVKVDIMWHAATFFIAESKEQMLVFTWDFDVLLLDAHAADVVHSCTWFYTISLFIILFKCLVWNEVLPFFLASLVHSFCEEMEVY